MICDHCDAAPIDVLLDDGTGCTSTAPPGSTRRRARHDVRATEFHNGHLKCVREADDELAPVAEEFLEELLTR